MAGFRTTTIVDVRQGIDLEITYEITKDKGVYLGHDVSLIAVRRDCDDGLRRDLVWDVSQDCSPADAWLRYLATI